jgi:16S rRNA (cytidine1402-2'-O)-methyltransferase
VSGVLYLVGTPIGNVGDLSERARATLGAADLVVAEDTRRTGRLLRTIGVERPLLSMFEGNEARRVEDVLARLAAGHDVAVVTDGGMPAISDPGYPLVRAAIDRGVEVRIVPGPSAATAALLVSGLPTDRFAFEGFLPRRPGDRARRLRALRDDPRTLVLFESPRRIRTLLREVVEELGDRRVALCRELTKLHEEVRRGPASQVLAQLGEVRGEVALVVAGAAEEPVADLEPLLAEVRRLVAEGMRSREAARAVAERHGASANELYRATLDGD